MIEQLFAAQERDEDRRLCPRGEKNNVTSDLTFEEMLWFGSQAVMGGAQDRECQLRHDAEHEQIVLQPRVPQNAVLRDAERAGTLLDLVNNELSPFVETFTMRDLDIMSVNADGSVSSSTGHVEDSKAAQPQNHHSSSGSQTGTGVS